EELLFCASSYSRCSRPSQFGQPSNLPLNGRLHRCSSRLMQDLARVERYSLCEKNLKTGNGLCEIAYLETRSENAVESMIPPFHPSRCAASVATHSITSSARARNGSGMLNPIALAVL